MTDLISRADAIEAVRKKLQDWGGYAFEDYRKGLYEAQDILEALPSAELPNGDLISRQWLLDLYGDYIGDNGDPKYHVPLEVVRQNIIDAPSADAEQVTSKLKNPCDSLLKDDSAECKEQKSKLEHDREWIIGCIKHDGFIKTDRFDKANQIILEALQAEWIPITEREPDTADHVLVTIKWGPDDFEVCELDYGVAKSEIQHTDSSYFRDIMNNIVAWRYMPGPYREGK